MGQPARKKHSPAVKARSEPQGSIAREKIRAPQQARSREGMDRVLKVLETLLREKPLASITMQELAQESGIGVSSIYARFEDKHAMMLGVHERLRDGAVDCLASLSSAARWEKKTNTQLVWGVVASSARYYQEHGPLIRALLLVDEPTVRERQARVLEAAAERFCKLLVSRGAQRSRKLEEAVAGACQIFVSTMYTELLFNHIGRDSKPIGNNRLLRQLTSSITALLEEVPGIHASPSMKGVR